MSIGLAPIARETLVSAWERVSFEDLIADWVANGEPTTGQLVELCNVGRPMEMAWKHALENDKRYVAIASGYYEQAPAAVREALKGTAGLGVRLTNTTEVLFNADEYPVAPESGMEPEHYLDLLEFAKAGASVGHVGTLYHRLNPNMTPHPDAGMPVYEAGQRLQKTLEVLPQGGSQVFWMTSTGATRASKMPDSLDTRARRGAAKSRARPHCGVLSLTVAFIYPAVPRHPIALKSAWRISGDGTTRTLSSINSDNSKLISPLIRRAKQMKLAQAITCE